MDPENDGQLLALLLGVRDCARPSARCPQLGVGKGSFYEREFYPVEEPMDEDCLYLNVWTPAQEVSILVSRIKSLLSCRNHNLKLYNMSMNILFYH